jgi:hypothetical protein
MQRRVASTVGRTRQGSHPTTSNAFAKHSLIELLRIPKFAKILTLAQFTAIVSLSNRCTA